MKKIIVSIIIPVYNAEKFIDQCLESVVNQTYTNIEIICINDGSVDNSLNSLKQWKKKDNRIIVINQKNSGPFISRNNGVKIAKGEYLLFLDSDDYLDTTTVEKLVNYRNKYQADIIKFKYQTFPIINNEYCFFEKTNFPLLLSKNEKYKIYSALFNTNLFNNLTTMFVLKKIYNNLNNSLNIKLSEDFFQSCYLYNHANSVLIVNDIFYYYRHNNNSTTHMIDYKSIENNISDEFLVYFSLNEIAEIWTKEANDYNYNLYLLNRLLNNLFYLFFNKIIRVNNIDKKWLLDIILFIDSKLSSISYDEYNFKIILKKYRNDSNFIKNKIKYFFITNMINHRTKNNYYLIIILNKIFSK